MTNTIPANTETIYARVKVNNAPQSTELKIRWILADSAQGDMADYQLKEDSLPVEGNMPIIIGLKRETDPFPRGEYLVKFMLNGNEKIAVPFKVQ